jgi:iron(III) transport system substrate-binding protein
MMILKTSQHADDAKAFIDYVLSPEGQARVADAWLMPARRDVAAKRPLLDALKVCPPAARAAASVAPSCPLQSAVCPVIDTVLRRWPPGNFVQEPV